MAENDSFSMKEMITIVMNDLKTHIEKYDADQDDLNDKFARRPTWGQMTGIVTVVGIACSIVVSLVG